MISPRPGAPKEERSTFSEADINTIVVDVCNRRKEAGEWLWYVRSMFRGTYIECRYIDLLPSTLRKGALGSIWRDLTKKEAKSGKKYLLVDRRQHARPRLLRSSLRISLYFTPDAARRGGPIRKWDRESATVKRSCSLLFDDDVPDLDDFIVPLWRGELDEVRELIHALECHIQRAAQLFIVVP